MLAPLPERPGKRCAAGFDLLPLILRAVLAGAVGGGTAALLMLSLQGLQRWLWGAAIGTGQAIDRPWFWCLALPIALGLLLSRLGAQTPPGRLPEFGDTLAALHQPAAPATPAANPTATSAGTPAGSGRWAPWRQALAGGLALLGGATIGPEALITHSVAALSRWLWRGRDQSVARAALAGRVGFVGLPWLGPIALAGRPAALLWRWLPACSAGIVAFGACQGWRAFGLAGTGPQISDFWPRHPLPALLTALLGAAIGWACGHALQRWRLWLQGRRRLSSSRLAPVATGLVLGLAMLVLPLAVFSGESQLQPLLLGSLPLKAPLLLLSGLAKLLLAGLCLETGWRGGLIFPAVAASAAIGSGLEQLVPGLAEAGIWCGSVVGGSLAVLMPTPLVALVLGLLLLHGQGAAALVVGVLISAAIKRRLSG